MEWQWWEWCLLATAGLWAIGSVVQGLGTRRRSSVLAHQRHMALQVSENLFKSGLTGRAVVIIPAYNEEDVIDELLWSVATSVRYLHDHHPQAQLQVVVVNDRSTDRTLEKAQHAVTSAQAEDIIRIVTSDEPPEGGGWLGKPWACHSGVQKIEELDQVDFVAFLDSDVLLAPEALARAWSLARVHQADLLSLAPQFDFGCLSERLVQPLMAEHLAMGMQAAIKDPQNHGGASGPFLWFARSAYESLDGHLTVRDQVIEDLALARLYQRNNRKVIWMQAGFLVKVRMYRSWADLRNGWGRTFALALGENHVILAMVVLMHLVDAVVPFVLLAATVVTGGWASGSVGWWVGGCIAGAWLARRWAALGGMRQFSAPPILGLAWLGHLLLSIVVAGSWYRVSQRKNWHWRGRNLADAAGVNQCRSQS